MKKSMRKVWSSLEIAKESIKAELKKLDKETVWVTSLSELRRISVHALLPACVSVFNEAVGIDTLLPLWVMVVVSAYIIHKKQLHEECTQGIFSGIAWVRFGTLLAIAILCSSAYPFLDEMIIPELKYFIGLEYVLRIAVFQAKACQHISLYRMYLSVFGTVAVTCRNNGYFQPIENIEQEKAEKNPKDVAGESKLKGAKSE